MLHAPIACQFEPKRENRRTSSPPDRWTGSLLRTSGIEAKPEDGIAAWLWVKDGQTKPGDEVQPVFFVALHSWMNREVHDSASPEVTPTVSSALGVLGTAEEFLKDSTAMLQTHTHTHRERCRLPTRPWFSESRTGEFGWLHMVVFTLPTVDVGKHCCQCMLHTPFNDGWSPLRIATCLSTAVSQED